MAVRALLAAAALAATSAPAAPAVPAAPAPASAGPAAAAQVPPAAPRRLEFPAQAGLPDVPVENPHDYRGAPYCAWCHEGRDPSVKGDPIALCAKCHAPSIMKHPYGRPAKQRPAALPLGADDRIVCHTCHDPHDVKAHRKGLRLDYQALCEQCHAGHGKKANAAPAPAAPASSGAARRAGPSR